ncbi:MAG: toll/interleukin-1 receptor domain-containing protein [Vicinamibacteria bacterium]
MTTNTATGEIQRRVAAGERDFQGAALSGVSLRGANLRGANLRGANLRGANLHGADLREAKMVRADLGMADVGMTDFGSADLNGADFRGANLKGANFGGATLDGANLRGADLNGADLRSAKLVRVDLSRADLRVADLSQADLRGADLRGADLTGANLKGASLHSATLHGADLRSADLTRSNLRGANLTDTRLESSNLTEAAVGGTVFADLDLRHVQGLETLQHASPSTIGADTLSRSLGKLPEGFLRGCGLTPWEICAAKEYDPSLSATELGELQQKTLGARAHARLQRKRILISCSQADSAFVDEVRKLLLERGISSWVAAHETKGALRERQSKLAIQHDLTLLLVLSESSVQSDWVEHEMRLARKLEKSLGEDVLCPVSLDESWKMSAWQGRITEKVTEESVLSFADWQDSSALQSQLTKLLDSIAIYRV